MNSIIIYYSFTGNNAKLAKTISYKLPADCIELKEIRKRTIFTIILDVAFNRTPKIHNLEKQIENYEHVIFIAPVWLGKVATPLRLVFQNIKGKNIKVSLICMSAGADGINPNLEDEIIRRCGIKPDKVFNPLISELLPNNPKPSRKMLDNYKISDTEAETLVNKIINQL